MEYEIWIMEYGMWNVKYGMWNMECGIHFSGSPSLGRLFATDFAASFAKTPNCLCALCCRTISAILSDACRAVFRHARALAAESSCCRACSVIAAADASLPDPGPEDNEAWSMAAVASSPSFWSKWRWHIGSVHIRTDITHWICAAEQI